MYCLIYPIVTVLLRVVKIDFFKKVNYYIVIAYFF